MQPVVDGLKQQYSNQIRFVDLDFYDKANAGLVQQFHVPGHPTFLLLDGQGKVVQRWIGVTPRDAIEENLKRVAAVK